MEDAEHVTALQGWIGKYSNRKKAILEGDGGKENKEEKNQEQYESMDGSMKPQQLQQVTQQKNEKTGRYIDTTTEQCYAIIQEAEIPQSVSSVMGQEFPQLDLETRYRVKSAEMELLKKNYTTLLKLAKECIQREVKIKTELSQMKNELHESQMSHDIEKHNLELECISLKRRLRLLGNSSRICNILEDMDEEVNELHEKNRCLENENIELQVLIDMNNYGNKERAAAKKCQDLQIECTELKEKIRQYKKRYRWSLLNQKSADKNRIELNHIQKRLQNLSSEVRIRRLSEAQIQAKSMKNEITIDNLKKEISALHNQVKTSEDGCKSDDESFSMDDVKNNEIGATSNDKSDPKVAASTDNMVRVDSLEMYLDNVKDHFPNLYPFILRLAGDEKKKDGMRNLKWKKNEVDIMSEAASIELQHQIAKELESLEIGSNPIYGVQKS